MNLHFILRRLIIILEIFYKLNGNLGYIITTSGVLLLLFGVLIQLLVTTIPSLSIIFKTSLLTFSEFIIMLLFSIIPLFVHEVIITFKKVTC